MASKPALAIITDLHITETNGDMVYQLFCETVNKVMELGVYLPIFIGGDIFDARKAQPLKSLGVFDDMLHYAIDNRLDVFAIPGNHDKVDYYSDKSYLNQFRYFPNFHLTTVCDYVDYGNIRVHMVPYFHESVYIDYLKIAVGNIDKTKKNLLITHIAVDGVKNNDGTEIQDTLATDLFKLFDRVEIGHYHNEQLIKSFLHYMGSFYQSNFGEDDKKGITIVYDDLSIEQIPTSFKRFETIRYDLDTLTVSDLDNICKDLKDKDQYTKIQFTGTREKLATLNKSQFDKIGVKTESIQKDDLDNITMQQAVKFDGFTRSDMPNEFIEFADIKGIDKDKGLNYLKLIGI